MGTNQTQEPLRLRPKVGRAPRDRSFVAAERRRIVFERLAAGFLRVDVAEMVNAHPSYVSRLLADHPDEYAAIFKKVNASK